jgi:hypothetical protein
MAAAPTVAGVPLAVKFANTLFRARGRLRDSIAGPDQLVQWLRGQATALGCADSGPLVDIELTDAQAADFVALRDAVRGLIRSATEQDEAGEEDLVRLNACAAAAPYWPQLSFGRDGFTTSVATDRPPVPRRSPHRPAAPPPYWRARRGTT